MKLKEYRIFVVETFWKDYLKIPKEQQKRIEKIKKQLKINPYSGKPLKYKFFREKKLEGNRLYYLIYEIQKIVLIVAYSGKKDQQATIDEITKRFEEFKQQIEKF